MATTETKAAAKDDAAPLLDVLEEDDEFEVRALHRIAGGARDRRQDSGLAMEKKDSTRMTTTHPHRTQEFADPDWDAAVDEAHDEQQWQVRMCE